MRDGRLAPSASSTVTLTIEPGSTGCVSRTTPSAPSKRPAGSCLAEPGRLTHAWYARPSTARPSPLTNRTASLRSPTTSTSRRAEAVSGTLTALGLASTATLLSSAVSRAVTPALDEPVAAVTSAHAPRPTAARPATTARAASVAQPGRGPVESVTGAKPTGLERGARCGRRRARRRSRAGDCSCTRPRISGPPDDARSRPAPSRLRPLAPSMQQPQRAVGFLPMWPSRSGVQVGSTKVSTPLESFTSTIGATKPARRLLQIGASR